MQKKRYRLLGVKCENSKRIFYPTKEICPSCWKRDSLKPFTLSPVGKIVSWSLIHAAPDGFEQLIPYPIALVRLEDGPTIMTQITDYDLRDLRIGKKVEAVFRKLLDPDRDSVIRYGIKFRPIR
jgi:hypothetical protein